jgi:Na+/glutamate symporter
LSTLGAIGGKRKDDEEEEPDVTMGVIAGLAIGTALAIYEHKKEKERNNENEIDKSTSAYNSQYEDAQNENEEYTGPVMSGM